MWSQVLRTDKSLEETRQLVCLRSNERLFPSGMREDQCKYENQQQYLELIIALGLKAS